MSTRRHFLEQAAAGAAALAALPKARLGALVTANDFIPPVNDDTLRAFALAAVDAARAAGAVYADVRVSAGHYLSVGSGWSRNGSNPLVPVMGQPTVRFGAGVNVRALVDGAWGFSGSDVVTAETVASCAKAAAGFAKRNRRPSEPALALAPGGATAKGEWTTPIERDPFAVPIAEQGRIQLDAVAGALRLKGLEDVSVGFSWWRRTHVFASTEGAVLTQRFAHALPGSAFRARVRGKQPGVMGMGDAEIEALRVGGYGWEAVQADRLPALVKAAAEEAIEQARLRAIAPVSAEVGRYDLVLSANAVGSLAMVTFAQALNLERAAGLRANTAGTSFVAPPLDMLGAFALAAPTISVRAERTAPDGAGTVAWDDEGVPASEATLLERGVVTDYLTSRETAVELAPWYQRRARPVRSNACSRSAATVSPGVCAPNLAVEGPAAGPTAAEIIADTKRGFFVERAGGGGDQQVFSNQFAVGGGAVRQIRDGKLGAPVSYFAAQFITAPFWKSVDAIGGVRSSHASVGYADGRVDSSDPIHFPFCTIRAVPARFKQVNVLNVGRTA